MPAHLLTDNACKQAKPKPKPYRMVDGEGLYLFVTETGAKSWRYRYRVAGSEKTTTLGLYPAISLADARKAHKEARSKVAQGISLTAPKKAMRGPTVEQAFAQYWDSRQDISPKYRIDIDRAFDKHFKPIAQKPIAQVERAEMLGLLLKIDRAGKTELAKKLRTYAALVWQWSIKMGYCQSNIPQSIRPHVAFSKKPVKHFPALTLQELPGFWRTVVDHSHLQSSLLAQMLAYTWLRTSEVTKMRYSEIAGALWRIPAERMKKPRDHIVPLIPQALALVEKLREYAQSDYVFESHRGKPVSNGAILSLIKKLGYQGKMTGHGFRTCASTWANEQGYSPDAIERQLSHAPDDKVRDAYNRAEYLPERTKMLHAWGDWLSKSLSSTERL